MTICIYPIAAQARTTKGRFCHFSTELHLLFGQFKKEQAMSLDEWNAVCHELFQVAEPGQPLRLRLRSGGERASEGVFTPYMDSATRVNDAALTLRRGFDGDFDSVLVLTLEPWLVQPTRCDSHRLRSQRDDARWLADA